MTHTPQRRAAMLVALTMLVLAATCASAAAASFTVSTRVKVLATGARGTVATVPDAQHVVVAFDGSGAAVRSYPPSDLALADAPDPAPDPTPDPDPTPRPGSLLGWLGFGVGSWPAASWRPYAADSPFNTSAIGQPVHPNSQSIVDKVLSLGNIGNLVAGNADTASDWGHPTYYAQPSDPVFRLDWTGGGPGAAIDGMQIRIPNAAQAAGGGDGHMTVVEPDGWEYDFWRVGTKPDGGGTMTFAGGGRTRVDGDGLDSGATAANFGNLAGVIRAQELAAGRINHALFIVVACTSKGTSFGYGTKTTSNGSMVYPASHGASACSSDTGDLPPVGARFQLAMTDAQIQALGVPGWKKTILTALAHYGGYVGDTGGPGFAFQFESGSTYTSFGATDPMVTFAKSADGVALYEGKYVFNMADGVDWERYLRVLVPPTP
jgi:hypothetical protein